MKYKSNYRMAGLFGAMVFALAACSNSGSSESESAGLSEDGAVSDAGESTPTGTLEDETAYVVVPEGTDMRINYASEAYEDMAEPDYILSQWDGMKTCLQVEAPDPYILVEGTVIPVSGANDTIQMPDQSYAASALDREYDAFIQIIVDDFDPETADRGYFFRQIIGPYMWRYNGYSERSYDPRCAAFVVR
ncbi:hypothetical protein Q4485_07615 [Granulosicoccaceae sp. 1_MG-2023]|nr:hypothetical protein [Granulosicoccaceae sp. 1_MG-2023]